MTNTATVTATASNGTVLTATAQATVKITGSSAAGVFTTYKQDQWGGSIARSLLTSNFASVYPGGLKVGGTYTITLTSAAAVDTLLPAGGAPQVLTRSYTNPRTTPAGELAGQVVALKLNVDFSNAGITKPGLAALKVAKEALAGYTVAQVLALAETVLGGDKSALPAGVDLNKLKDACKKINENYEKGEHDRDFLVP